MPSEARKRELKEQYKAMRPEMGVFVFRCVPTGKNYVGWTHDLKGTLNSLRFQLESVSYTHLTLPTNSLV